MRPIEIARDTYIKVPPFRKGLTQTPFNIPCELAGKTVGALFRRENMRPVVVASHTLQPGLDAEYPDGPWPALFGHAGVPGVLPVMARAVAAGRRLRKWMIRTAEVRRLWGKINFLLVPSESSAAGGFA